jgi:hypothetical protein
VGAHINATVADWLPYVEYWRDHLAKLAFAKKSSAARVVAANLLCH